MDTHSFKKRIAELYERHFIDRVFPHLNKIYSLFKPEPENWQKKDEGGHSGNRKKYFEADRKAEIVDIISRSFPAIAGEKQLNILDLGCGFGEFSAIFRAFGHNVVSLNGGDTWYLDDFRYVCKDLLDLNYYEFDLMALTPSLVEFDYIFASEILTLDLLKDKTDEILERLYKVSKQVIIVCHKGRTPIYDYTKFSPEIHRSVHDYINIITYYSNDDYKLLAENLVTSAKRFGYHPHAVQINDVKHWGKAITDKPRLIAKYYQKFGAPLLYLDADCEIIKPLDDFVKVIKENDLCIRERNLVDKYNLGVMGLGLNSQKLIPLLEEWKLVTQKSFGTYQTVDQKPLESLLQSKYRNIKIHKLHPYYNFLPADSLDYNPEKAVILHHKESKENPLARAWRNEMYRRNLGV